MESEQIEKKNETNNRKEVAILHLTLHHYIAALLRMKLLFIAFVALLLCHFFPSSSSCSSSLLFLGKMKNLLPFFCEAKV